MRIMGTLVHELNLLLSADYMSLNLLNVNLNLKPHLRQKHSQQDLDKILRRWQDVEVRTLVEEVLELTGPEKWVIWLEQKNVCVDQYFREVGLFSAGKMDSLPKILPLWIGNVKAESVYGSLYK